MSTFRLAALVWAVIICLYVIIGFPYIVSKYFNHPETNLVKPTRKGKIRDTVLRNCTVLVRKKYVFDSHPRFPHGHQGFPSPQLNLRLLTKEQVEIKDSPKITSRREKVIKSLYGFNGERSWLKHVNSLDDDNLAPLTKFAQNVIYQHQNPHPSRCKGKRFLVVTHFENAGIGALTHFIGSALGRAIDYNRILMWDIRTNSRTTGWHYFDAGCAGNSRHDTLDCLYEPLTSCSYEHSNENNTVYTNGWDDGTDKDEPWHKFSAPSLFTQALLQYSAVPITPTAIKYWWRGQATAYILRLNELSLSKIRALRLDPLLHTGFTVDKSSKLLQNIPVPFPMPAHSFNIHVRHGDKGKEMRLIPFRQYVEEAEWFAKQNPNSYHKLAFLSSEDPSIFDEAKQITSVTFDYGLTSPNENWIWYMSKIKRLNTGPVQQLRVFQSRSDATLSWLLQLFMALECDGFVGTLNSNWNRIIDELRCIWTDKCMQPYLEVGDVVDWANYHW
ncbi:unnamed protein product [Adineta ricciae]|uniref:Uncharacterized protein n=1 Tax=Adineta ricciae TaxID=249248 RepID=A0A816FBA0_ADIRI|nr:unnamed protein product [Adineta ricciae]CAF1659469.1 unnamed protein product [Adineta ricciae]